MSISLCARSNLRFQLGRLFAKMLKKWWNFPKIWKNQFIKAKPFLLRNFKKFFFWEFHFLCIPAFVRNQTFVNNSRSCSSKRWKQSWKFRIVMEIWNKNYWICKFISEKLPMKEILSMNYKWGDLLYEFPAETKLTVYRRRDITRRAGVFPMEVLTRRAGVFPRGGNTKTMTRRADVSLLEE